MGELSECWDLRFCFLNPGSRNDSCSLDYKVYVGNLVNNGNKPELERAFGDYGPLQSVWVAGNPPGFLLSLRIPRVAADTIREPDGRTVCGCCVRVELLTGEKRSRNLTHLSPRVVTLEMITIGGVLHLGKDLQEGEASLEARAGLITTFKGILDEKFSVY